MANWTEDDLRAKGYRKDGSKDPALRLDQGRNKAGEAGDVACMPASSVAGPAGGADERSPPAGQNKYGAIRTIAPASWGGERMADSRTGAKLSRTLATRKLAGSIVDWFEEVSVPIGVNEAGRVIRYRADAMILLGYIDAPDGAPALVVRFVDAKRANMDTPTSKAKRAALRNRGLNVQVV